MGSVSMGHKAGSRARDVEDGLHCLKFLIDVNAHNKQYD